VRRRRPWAIVALIVGFLLPKLAANGAGGASITARAGTSCWSSCIVRRVWTRQLVPLPAFSVPSPGDGALEATISTSPRQRSSRTPCLAAAAPGSGITDTDGIVFFFPPPPPPPPPQNKHNKKKNKTQLRPSGDRRRAGAVSESGI